MEPDEKSRAYLKFVSTLIRHRLFFQRLGYARVPRFRFASDGIFDRVQRSGKKSRCLASDSS